MNVFSCVSGNVCWAACKSRGFDLRVHFKNTRETAQAIKGMHLRKAIGYLCDVEKKKQIVPFRRYNGGVGRKAQVRRESVCVVSECIETSAGQELEGSGVSRKVACEECGDSAAVVEECREQC